jgi:hypothetical protein
MLKWGASVLGITSLIFASFSSSSTYQLKSYSIGPGATNNSSSSTYKLQGSVGEQANNTTGSTTYKANNSSIQAEQLNVPPAPALSNSSGTYYNQLNCIVNTANNPTDTTYAIAISTDNFTTTNYVQANGTIGASAVYQTYATWGGASGFQIVGLTSSTTYYVKVAAKQGLFTNTAYGAVASLATASPTLSFSVSPTSANIGSFLPNTITTSSNISFTYATNGASGGGIYVKGSNGGFHSATKGFTIAAVSGDLSSLGQGFGIQATSPSQTSGGPLTTVSPYNGTSHTVGAESSTAFAQMFATSAAIVGGTATANVQVKAPGTAPAANDYNEVFTFIASASF